MVHGEEFGTTGPQAQPRSGNAGKITLGGRKKGNMVNDLRQAVNKLRALAPQLNNAVDEANRVVAVVERFLAQECHLGVEADIPVTYNDKGKATLLLKYGPVEGSYRIALTHSDGESRFVTHPWANCDRSEKLTSFAVLPRLLMAVAKAVETQIASTTATVTTVTQIMSALAQPLGHGEVSTMPDLAILIRGDMPSPAKSNGNGHAHSNGNGNARPVRNPGEKEHARARTEKELVVAGAPRITATAE